MFKVKAAFSGFSVNDLAAAKHFYGEVLGFKLADDKMGLDYELPGGGQVFIYDKPNHQPAAYTMLNLIVEDIDSAIDELSKKGVRFERYDNLPAPQDKHGVLRGRSAHQGPDIAWFKDPADNILGLLQV